ncbi:MAG: ribonuclease P protein component [Prevotellaceae bacterium]|jgi:ribonuclease P protein component|nr:ribonuclease P protein component [Prevotellaceae bacterium]
MGRFPKRARKISAIDRELLFREGTVLFHYPYKLFFSLQPAPIKGTEYAIVVAVPKRNVKRAVDRNLIRRRIKESFRTSNSILISTLKEHKLHIQLFCLYLPDEHTASATLCHKMESLLERLAYQVTQSGALSLSRDG